MSREDERIQMSATNGNKMLTPDTAASDPERPRILSGERFCPDTIDDLEEAAKKAGQKYFPDEYNIWARPNYEAKAAEDAFKDGVNWQKMIIKLKEQKLL